jgi:lysophospholipase L1-like esterase
MIGRLADGRRVFYSDLGYRMLSPDGSLGGGLFAPDGIHITPSGYRAWATLLAAEIARLKLLEQ